jgi:o-succinylbenzoate synthase
MKITRIDVIPIDIPLKRRVEMTLGTWEMCNFVLTKVYTDEGVVGYGEVPPWMPVSRESQGTVVSVVKDFLGPCILGMNPFDIELIWHRMDLAVPANPMAKTAVDLALYDIMGKALNVPLYNLLGGKVQNKLPLCGIIGYGSTEGVLDQVSRWISAGYETIRLKIGRGLREDVHLVAAVRKAIGDKVKIRVDANQAYTPSDAIRVIHALDEFDIEFVEQPVAWYDLAGSAQVLTSVNTPIMLHESLYTAYDVVHIIQYKAANVFGLKLDRPGGITNGKKVLAIAELFSIPVFVCSSIELGVSTAASAQFAAASYRNIKFACEMSGPVVISDDIVQQQVMIESGHCIVPDGPGFGVELDESKVKKYGSSIIIIKH